MSNPVCVECQSNYADVHCFPESLLDERKVIINLRKRCPTCFDTRYRGKYLAFSHVWEYGFSPFLAPGEEQPPIHAGHDHWRPYKVRTESGTEITKYLPTDNPILLSILDKPLTPYIYMDTINGIHDPNAWRLEAIEAKYGRAARVACFPTPHDYEDPSYEPHPGSFRESYMARTYCRLERLFARLHNVPALFYYGRHQIPDLDDAEAADIDEVTGMCRNMDGMDFLLSHIDKNGRQSYALEVRNLMTDCFPSLDLEKMSSGSMSRGIASEHSQRSAINQAHARS